MAVVDAVTRWLLDRLADLLIGLAGPVYVRAFEWFAALNGADD